MARVLLRGHRSYCRFVGLRPSRIAIEQREVERASVESRDGMRIDARADLTSRKPELAGCSGRRESSRQRRHYEEVKPPAARWDEEDH